MKKILLGLVIILGIVCLTSCSKEEILKPSNTVNLEISEDVAPLYGAAGKTVQVVVNSDRETQVSYRLHYQSNALIPGAEPQDKFIQAKQTVVPGVNKFEIFTAIGGKGGVTKIEFNY